MFCPKLKDESGMAMIIIMAVTFLGTILTGSYMGLVIHESKEASRQKHRVQVLFLAEAGIEKSLYYLNNPDDPENPWVDDQDQLLATPLYYTGYLAEGRYEVTLVPADVPRRGAGDARRRVERG